MRQKRFRSPSALASLTLAFALASVATACKHAGGSTTTGGGGGSSGQGTGGSSGQGTGGSSGQGTGGSSGPGTGGNSGSGTGGAMEIPDGGTPNVPKAACNDDPNQQHVLSYTPGYVIDGAAATNAMNTVNNMTPAQKANQMRGTAENQYTDIFRTAPDSSGVKEFLFNDGPRGVNLDATKPAGGQGFATVYPAASARGASFDVDLENQIGVEMGDEMAAAGRTMLLAPTVNILRHPAWARAQETYGEDMFLLGRLGPAYVAGVQTYVPACAKHYAGNNVDRQRETQIAQMDEQTLQEVYARHFGMIIKDSGVACVMAAYNLVQAPPTSTALNCTQNRHLLNDILRGPVETGKGFGFRGFVMSDWWAVPGGRAPNTAARSTNARQALQAGLDMEMPWNLNFMALESLGLNTELTAAATRVVTEKFRFKVNNPSGAIGLKAPTTRLSGQYSITGNEGHIATAQRAAGEGMVLLKNQNNTLPIKRDGSIRTVAVVGLPVPWQLMGAGAEASGTINFATDVRTGDLGSSRVNLDPSKGVGPYAGINAAKPSGITVTTSNDISAAQNADFVVVVAGLTPQDEGEDYTISPQDSDRGANMGLDGKRGGTQQNAFIRQVAALGKPMAVVLEGGSIIDISNWESMVPAIVMAWYPGQSGGVALGDLLFGNKNFSGRLPMSWPRVGSDLPAFSTPPTTNMSYYLGYRWWDTMAGGKTPLYPFGHGLSYTTYSYANLQVPCTTVTKKGVVNVLVDVTNTGTVAGDEVVMMFVSWPSSTVANRRAAGYKELKGFARVALNPGQTKRVPLPLRVSDLDYYDVAGAAWKIESGAVKVMVGKNATDPMMLSDTFTVQ